VSSVYKRLLFPSNDIYHYDAYQLVKKIEHTKTVKVSLVADVLNKNKKFLMIQTKNSDEIRKYSKEQIVKQDLGKLSKKEKRLVDFALKLYNENGELTVIKENRRALKWQKVIFL